jgi:hypothetical protein
MSQGQLMALIGIVAVALVTICAVLFIIFSRFLNREKERGETFRSVHRKD